MNLRLLRTLHRTVDCSRAILGKLCLRASCCNQAISFHLCLLLPREGTLPGTHPRTNTHLFAAASTNHKCTPRACVHVQRISCIKCELRMRATLMHERRRMSSSQPVNVRLMHKMRAFTCTKRNMVMHTYVMYCKCIHSTRWRLAKNWLGKSSSSHSVLCQRYSKRE